MESPLAGSFAGVVIDLELFFEGLEGFEEEYRLGFVIVGSGRILSR